MIVEGAHLVPGFLKEDLWDKAVVIQMVLVVDDIDRHRGHFYVRDQETGGVRSLEKYVESMDKIRRVQDYLVQAAQEGQGAGDRQPEHRRRGQDGDGHRARHRGQISESFKP